MDVPARRQAPLGPRPMVERQPSGSRRHSASSEESDSDAESLATTPEPEPRRRVTFVTVPLADKADGAASALGVVDQKADAALTAGAHTLLALGAPSTRQPRVRDLLSPLAEFLHDPAQKCRVGELPGRGKLEAALGPAVAQASYLLPMHEHWRAFRLGRTTMKGSYSKIRDFVDERGEAGKMRVLHLTRQRAEEPRLPVEVTHAQEFQLELIALRKAKSPVAYDRYYSVVDDDYQGLAVKLYLPMRNLGLDTFYLNDNNAVQRKDTRPAAAAIRAYLAGINRALVPLHRNEAELAGMVHRDIKPENVLFDGAGNVNLIDFGLASFSNRLLQGPFAGTAGYVAPEYLASAVPGSDASVWPLTPKLDLWSLATATLMVWFTDVSYSLPQQQIVRDGAVGNPNAHINLSLLQEAWQRGRDGFALSAAQQRELERTHPRGQDAASRESFRARYFAQLDGLQAAIDRVDPAMGQWFFRRLYRPDPRQRFDSAQLAQALAALPPLYGDRAADREAARSLYASLYPRAHAAMVQENGLADASSGPTLAQLRALPALPET